jgi:hypothetical protein
MTGIIAILMCVTAIAVLILRLLKDAGAMHIQPPESGYHPASCTR